MDISSIMDSLSKMSAHDALRELQEDVRCGNERLKVINYNFIQETADINFLDFHQKNVEEMWAFELHMDLSPKRKLFANHLGLDSHEIMWCEEHYKTGPTQEIFKFLAKKNMLQNLTLYDVLNSLKKLELTAMFTLIKWSECVNRYKAASHNSQSFSLMIHHRPEVLVNSANVGTTTVKEGSSINHNHLKTKPKILMIFASDASEEALRVASQLKTPREIRVLILTGTPPARVTESLRIDPWNSIHKWFKEVDFVVPVLSRQLLRQIQVQDSDKSTLAEMQYNRYVYRLLLDDYVSKMSKNYKCRALCSQECKTEVCESELVKGNGLLEMNWDCSSEQVEMLAEVLIAGARRNRTKFTCSE